MFEDLLFLKLLAAVHFFVGMVSLSAFQDPEFTKEVYANVNPLLGDLVKGINFVHSFLLLLVGFAAWWIPWVTPYFAWAATVMYLLAPLLFSVIRRQWPSMKWGQAVSVVIRLLAAIALTVLAPEHVGK